MTSRDAPDAWARAYRNLARSLARAAAEDSRRRRSGNPDVPCRTENGNNPNIEERPE